MIRKEDKILTIAFLISIIIHLFIFFPWSIFFINKDSAEKIEQKKILKKLDIIYNPVQIKESLPKKNKGIKQSNKNVIVTEREKIEQEKSFRQKQAASGVDNKKIVKVEEKKIIKVKDTETRESDSDKEESPIGLEQVSEIERPAFIQYYRYIRNKIEVTAQSNSPDYFKEGDVNIRFKLDSTGKILSIAIDESRSTVDRVLRNSAIESIKMSSPFPPFPEGLTSEELVFTVTIEFHI